MESSRVKVRDYSVFKGGIKIKTFVSTLHRFKRLLIAFQKNNRLFCWQHFFSVASEKTWAFTSSGKLRIFFFVEWLSSGNCFFSCFIPGEINCVYFWDIFFSCFPSLLLCLALVLILLTQKQVAAVAPRGRFYFSSPSAIFRLSLGSHWIRYRFPFGGRYFPPPPGGEQRQVLIFSTQSGFLPA